MNTVMEDESVFFDVCCRRIVSCENIIQSLEGLASIRGMSKLKKKILEEKKFLSQVMNSGQVSQAYIASTNLTHFEALMNILLKSNDCISILETFAFHVDGEVKKITVDIVAQKGQQWIKVVAKNSKALRSLLAGNYKYGHRSLFDQARDFHDCAVQNPTFYSPPVVVFNFVSGIDDDLAQKFVSVGITVSTTFENAICAGVDDVNLDETHQQGQVAVTNMHKEYVPKLNLDTTTMIAYVSAMTNGDNQYTYDVIPLNQHRDAEERKEVKPILEFFFEGKKLYCCETAVNVFKNILDTLGGTHEKVRAGQLMKNIEIIADCMSDRVKGLVLGGKIKERSRTVFGTGDAIKAVTVTANEGFYRAAKNQGVELAVFIHESRSLSEVASKRAQPRY